MSSDNRLVQLQCIRNVTLWFSRQMSLQLDY